MRRLALLAALAGCTPGGPVVYAFPQLVLRDTGGIARVHLSLWRDVGGVIQSAEAPLVLDCGGSSCEGRLVDLQLQGDLAGTLWLVAVGEPAPGQLAKRWRGTLPRDAAQTEVKLSPVGCTDEDRDGFCADAAADFGAGWLDCDDGAPDFGPKDLCAKPVPPALDVADVLQDDATDSVTTDVYDVYDSALDVPDESSPPDAGGGLGAPCLSGADCASGHCISGSDAALTCTAPCSDGNPDACADTGWTCVAAPAGAAAGGLCLPPGACYPGAAVACCGAPDVECAAEGVATCPPAPVETCNGQDDDCDGETDEGSVTPEPGDECESEGVCAGVSPKCSKTADGFLCDYASDAPGYAADESQGALCDDLDNDCDGLTDEDWPEKDGACAAGVGACQNVGLIACTGDHSATACDVTGEPPATACDDGDGATHSDHCSGGEGSTCVGTAYECTADGLDCTDEVPQGDGTCLSVVKPGFCAVANACVAAGAVNPLNECEACDPSSSTSEWLARPNGTLCDDGNSCTSDDACGEGDCAGVGLGCDDGLDCTVDDCDGTTCIAPHPIKAGSCLVDGVCFAGGQQDPLNPCASCDPQVLQTEFAPRANGTPCSDGKKCTLVDSCQLGICTGGAFNVCDDENACTDDACDEGSAAPDGCTHVDTANACDDGNGCTKEDVCTPQGTCVGTALTSLDCTDNNPCTADFCSGTTGCDHQALDGTSCDDDGISCTEDKCVTGTCAHTKIDASFCLIGGACVATGANDPANQCKACLPASSQSAYTSKAELAGCNFDSNGCTKDDVCQSGVCTKGANVTCPDPSDCQVGACVSTSDNTSSCGLTAKPDGTACATDGLSCTTDACDGSGTCQHTTQVTKCLIEGTCYDDGAMNPDKECSVCKASAPSVWSSAAKDAVCDDGNGCTKSDVCTAQGACAGTALTSLDCTDDNTCTVDFCSGTTGCDHQALDGTTCDDDGIACTEDTCAAGTCTHTKVDSAYCFIGGKCIAAGSDDPANQCKACLPTSSQSAYTSKVELAGCNFDSDGCTKDDACKAGVCTKGATVTCPDPSDCQTAACTSTGDNTSACVVSAKANGTACTADSLACTADQCTGGVCAHNLTAGCIIQNACVVEGTKNPANVCQACLSATKTDGYSNQASSTPCTADALSCTTDACDGNGTCQHTTQATTCLIEGTCYDDGASNPDKECSVCKASAPSLWSSAAKDAVCDDGNGCTKSDACTAQGACAGTALTSLDCTDENTCTVDFCSGTTGCDHQALDGTTCDDDGIACTEDKCAAGTCTHTKVDSAYCLIGGKCIAAGSDDPANQCKACLPTSSQSAYTSKVELAGCNFDSDGCTKDDACKAGVCTKGATVTCPDPSDCQTAACTSTGDNTSACVVSAKANGAACTADGLACTADKCASGVCTHSLTSGCIIQNACVVEGTKNPANACQACLSATKTDGYSNQASGTPCTADAQSCTTDACDGSGVCQHAVKAGFCIIGGASCVASGVLNPSNSCESCQPSVATNQYSKLAVGSACASDTLSCTDDACDGSGVCQHVTQATKCLINVSGTPTCFNHGDADPAKECRICDAAVNTSAFTARAVFTPCTADAFECTKDYCDGAGACIHPNEGTTKACTSDNNPCTDDKCNGSGSCVHNNLPATTACDSDAFTCTTQKCNGSGTCVLTNNADTCLISGVCYNDGDDLAGNVCKKCDSGQTQVAATNKGNDTDCGTCAICTNGTCSDDLTQNTDCGTCQKCVAGKKCGNQSASQDIKGECDTNDGCQTGNCNNAGGCGVTAATDCGTCAKCSAGACVDDLTQHSDCPKCQKCKAGKACQNQTASEDLKNQCTSTASNCVLDLCNGSGDCGVKASTVTCRAAATECDAAELCDGTSATCPTDAKQPAATPCTADAKPCSVDQCDGTTNVCTHTTPAASSVVCRAAADECDLAESCSGATTTCPTDVKKPDGTACTSDGNPCSLDQCNGTSAACQHTAPASNTVICRAAAGECDLQETCTGTTMGCPTDVRKLSGTACTTDGNPCSLDQCDGSSAACEHSLPESNSVTCRTAVDVCDAAESCDGTTKTCPADVSQPDETSCGVCAACTAGLCEPVVSAEEPQTCAGTHVCGPDGACQAKGAAVAAGTWHTCVIDAAGAARCWGRNDQAQLGDGTWANKSTPTQVSGLTGGVKAITAGVRHTCAIAPDGAARCWGYNDFGQLGDSTTSTKATNVQVSGLTSGAQSIAAGAYHTCAIDAAGAVKCWGLNEYGRLGNGTTTNQLAPVQVTGLTGGAQGIASGDSHTCGIDISGAAKCWGWNYFGQLGDGTLGTRSIPVLVSGLTSGVQAIAAGSFHTCALDSAGSVKCWGRNDYGQLGDGNTANTSIPVQVSGLTSGVQAIAAIGSHTCAITAAGAVKCWGNNNNGQLGDGTTGPKSTPVSVSDLPAGIQAIAGAFEHTCAIDSAGSVKCWGSNAYGQLGDGSLGDQTAPVTAFGLVSGITSVAAGANHACALSSSGGLRCWGRNEYGQIGDGTDAERSVPVDVTGLVSGVVAVDAGDSHTCAVTSSGAAKCWGMNLDYQCGDGTTMGSTHNTPTSVAGLGSGVVSIVAGGTKTCALLAGGTVRCWGSGPVGDGSNGKKSTPTDVSGLGSGVIDIAVSDDFSCAVTASGAARCWGAGSSGFGYTPVDVTGLASGVTSVVCAESHLCALLSDGAAKCRGLNPYGQLGNGSTTDSSLPVNVVGLGAGVLELAAGQGRSCAIATGGALLCWGFNYYGQLGDGSTNSSTTPVNVIGMGSGTSSPAAGGDHTCAVTSGGAVACWGRNNWGQLGNGPFGKPTPSPVLGYGP